MARRSPRTAAAALASLWPHLHADLRAIRPENGRTAQKFEGVVGWLAALRPDRRRPVPLASVVRPRSPRAPGAAQATGQAADQDPQSPSDGDDDVLAGAEQNWEQLVESGADVVSGGGGTPLLLGDALSLAVVLLLRELAAADPEAPARGWPGTEPAVRLAARTLTELLTEQVPGRSVELRVPPYAAVQCVAGPRHTRGTPPAVIETDPLTWVRLATGARSWAAAVAEGRVVASGERAALGAALPVVAEADEVLACLLAGVTSA